MPKDNFLLENSVSLSPYILSYLYHFLEIMKYFLMLRKEVFC